MVFNSITFFLFFGAVFLLFQLTPHKFRWLTLLAASTFFYAWAQPAMLAVPVGISLIAWFAGMRIEAAPDERSKTRLLTLGVLLIAGLLVFFKYTNFFTNSVTDLINLLRGNDTPLKNNLLISLAAPLGISYVSFQAIGYLVEIKRGDQPAEKNFGHLVSYLLLFTKIIAGPVERAHHFLPQLKTQQAFSYDLFASGCKQALWGLFKKIVIADRLAIYVDAVYNNYPHHSGITLAAASVVYALQIYADFSGYTDMALGFSRMLGYELTPNFNRPLLARSVTEFWRKWHMSLSTWFADYFYNPIAVAKRDWGTWAVVFASFTTFTVLGFWHGANWTYIVFGFLQACFLAVEIFTRKARKNMRKKIPAWLNDGGGILITFSCFVFSSIFFKAPSVTDALGILKGILQLNGPLFYDNASTLMFMLMGIGYLTLYEWKKEFMDAKFTISNNRYWLIRNGYYCTLIIIILATAVFDGGEFIYFQF